MPEFLIWQADHNDHIAFINGPVGFRKSYRLSQGVPLAKEWSSEVHFKVDDDYKKWNRLGDNLHETPPVVSGHLKEILEGAKVKHVEFLPTAIKDAKGKTLSDSYFVINPLMISDCIDLGASEVEWNTIDEEMIQSCKRVVIEAKRVDSEVGLFRAKHLKHRVLIRRALADQLVSAGVTGLSLHDPVGHNGTTCALDSLYWRNDLR